MLSEYNQKPEGIYIIMIGGARNFMPANPTLDTTGSVTDAQNNYQQAQQAQMVSQNFGLPMQGQNPGVWANILPAAIQIEEHKKMNEVAMKYQQKYVKDFQEKYGFKEKELEDLKGEFNDITDHITGLIPDGELRTMYKKYVQSYPHMYLSMIPAEALQSKLAVKCHNDNKILRKEIASMSQCVTTLVQSLSKLQMAAGVPPIVSLMFESMPDPLTAITDPMYSSYNDAITTYHKLLNNKSVYMKDSNGADITKDGEYYMASSALLVDPVGAIDQFKAQGVSEISDDQFEALKAVIGNMKTSSGCQAYGNEWNHTGPEPAMNPAMCLGEADVMQPGNPRNAHGRTAVYKAQRTQDGGAQWVMKGQVPNATGQASDVFGHAQLAHSAKYHQQPQGDWGGYGQMQAPRVSRKKRSSKTSGKKKGRKSSK